MMDNQFKMVYHEEPFEHFLIENIFTDKELFGINQELNFLSINGSFENDLFDGTHTLNGVKQAKRKTLFLSYVYKDFRTYSLIYRFSKKGFVDDIFQHSTLGRLIQHTNEDDLLISYYGDNDYYHPHNDRAVCTYIIHLWSDRDGCEGGELVFPDYNYKINCDHNTAIFFPSPIEHQVTPLKTKNPNTMRISFSTFLGLSIHKKNNAHI